MISEITTLKKVSQPTIKRRCPDCGSILLLEAVYGDGYWWSCLLCGLHRPAKGIDAQVGSTPRNDSPVTVRREKLATSARS
ncbi:MAG TPA: hypothetical protein VF960_15620 [Chloroflexota bacterium]